MHPTPEKRVCKVRMASYSRGRSAPDLLLRFAVSFHDPINAVSGQAKEFFKTPL